MSMLEFQSQCENIKMANVKYHNFKKSNAKSQNAVYHGHIKICFTGKALITREKMVSLRIPVSWAAYYMQVLEKVDN